MLLQTTTDQRQLYLRMQTKRDVDPLIISASHLWLADDNVDLTATNYKCFSSLLLLIRENKNSLPIIDETTPKAERRLKISTDLKIIDTKISSENQCPVFS